jgi:hypothetical protein
MMLNNHLPEHIVDTYFLNPEAVTPEEKARLKAHLKECSLCSELFETTANFYKELNAETQRSPSGIDEELVEKLTSRKRLFLSGRSRELKEKTDSIIEGFAEIIEPFKGSVFLRVLRSVRLHPVTFAAGGIGLAAALAMLLFFLKPLSDTNINYVRAKDEFLVAYNKDGGELWRKHIGLGYDSEHLQKELPSTPIDQYLAACDVDRDGRNEVIAIFGIGDGFPRQNCIVCYNANGSERWVYEIHRSMVFGKDSVPDHYTFRRFAIGNSRSNGAVEIYAVASQVTYFQADIVRLNASNGNDISDYWHSGCISQMMIADVDNDGKKELILGAENNGYNLASVFILDPGNMKGYAPAPAEYTPQNVSPGTEEYYLLFPRCDLEKFAVHKRNACTSIQVVPPENSLLFYISEQLGTSYYPIIYHFDHSMNCTLVEGEDGFVTFHTQLQKEGKLTESLDANYYDHLSKNVQYWNGGKFVNTPALNSNFNLSVAEK